MEDVEVEEELHKTCYTIGINRSSFLVEGVTLGECVFRS